MISLEQKELFNKLRAQLKYRGIDFPSIKKFEENITLNRKNMGLIIHVMIEEKKNLDAFEYSISFREALYEKYGHSKIKKIIYEELRKFFIYLEELYGHPIIYSSKTNNYKEEDEYYY